MAAACGALLHLSCDADGPSDSSVREIVGTSREALTIGQTTINAVAGQVLTETSATAFRTAGGAWQRVNASNSGAGRFDYSCTADNYASWCSHTLFMGAGNTAALGDVGLVSNGGATPRTYGVTMTSARDGYWFFRTTNPCPVSGGSCQNSSWETSRHTVASPTLVDLPQILASPTTGDIWIVSRGNTGMLLAKHSYGQAWNTNLTLYSNPCAGLVGKSTDRFRAAFDSNGQMHIVFVNYTDGIVQYEQFAPSGGGAFLCGLETVGPVNLPPDACGCGGVPTIPDLTNTCVRSLTIPNITVDMTANSMVVSYETNAGGACSGHTETRVYRKATIGSPWSYRMHTGCHTSVMPAVASINDGTSNVHMMTLYNPSGTGNLRPVNWTSVDGGATWNNGTYIGNSITFAGVNCYAGDYVSIVQDPPNASYFFTWGQNTPNWTIQGAVRGK